MTPAEFANKVQDFRFDGGDTTAKNIARCFGLKLSVVRRLLKEAVAEGLLTYDRASNPQGFGGLSERYYR